MRRALLASALSAFVCGSCLAAAAATVSYRDAVLADQPAVYYPFDETEGDVAQNLGWAGEELSGFYMNGVELGRPTAFPSQMGTCGYYNGSSFVSIKANPLLNVGTGDFSIELWYNAGRGGPLFNNRAGESHEFSILSSLDAGVDDLLIIDRTPDSALQTSTTADADAGHWHHLVLTRTSGYYDLYIDAARHYLGAKQLLISPPIPGDVSITDFNDEYNVEKRIGGLFEEATGNEVFFTGLIDEFALYGTALTPSQVKVHYDAATGVPEPGMWAFLSMALGGLLAYVWRKRR
jgi:hypothetical protein